MAKYPYDKFKLRNYKSSYTINEVISWHMIEEYIKNIKKEIKGLDLDNEKEKKIFKTWCISISFTCNFWKYLYVFRFC